MRALCEKQPLSIPVCSFRNFLLASPHQLRNMSQHNSAQANAFDAYVDAYSCTERQYISSTLILC